MAKAADKGKKDAGKGGKGGAAGAAPSTVRLWSSRGRAIGSLVGFAVASWVSHKAGIGLTDSALRGLIGAVAFSFIGWWCALLAMTGLMRSAVLTERVEVLPAAPAGRTTATAGAPRPDPESRMGAAMGRDS